MKTIFTSFWKKDSSIHAEEGVSSLELPSTIPELPSTIPKLPLTIPEPPLPVEIKEVKRACQGWHPNTIIGRGRTSKVYIARFGPVVFAIKRLRKFKGHRKMSQHKKACYNSELEILKGLHHDNIVKLRGWCEESNELVIVLEYVSDITLDFALHDAKMVLSWEDRMKIALATARAIEYLHTQPIPVLHRDITSSNILIGKQQNAKLIDFGVGGGFLGTIPYTAPEYRQQSYAMTTKCDIHSFGVVLLEIITGRKPLTDGVPIKNWVVARLPWDHNWNFHARELIDGKIRASVPEVDISKIMRLAIDCVVGDPDMRPNATSVVCRLLNISCLSSSRASGSGTTGKTKNKGEVGESSGLSDSEDVNGKGEITEEQ